MLEIFHGPLMHEPLFTFLPFHASVSIIKTDVKKVPSITLSPLKSVARERKFSKSYEIIFPTAISSRKQERGAKGRPGFSPANWSAFPQSPRLMLKLYRSSFLLPFCHLSQQKTNILSCTSNPWVCSLHSIPAL